MDIREIWEVGTVMSDESVGAVFCPSCDAPNFSNATHCKRCGHSLPNVVRVAMTEQATRPVEKYCPACKGGSPPNALQCMWCGVAFGYQAPIYPPVPPITSSAIELNQILGIVGSVILGLGVLAPVFSGPFGFNFAYWEGDGKIIAVLAFMALVLSIQKKYKWLFIPALGSLALLIFVYFNFQSKIRGLQSDAEGLSSALMSAFGISWGWFVMVIGVALLIAAAWMPPRQIASLK